MELQAQRIGLRIKVAREQRGLSQTELAKSVGKAKQHISLIEPASWTQIFIYGESRRIMQ